MTAKQMYLDNHPEPELPGYQEWTNAHHPHPHTPIDACPACEDSFHVPWKPGYRTVDCPLCKLPLSMYQKL